MLVAVATLSKEEIRRAVQLALAEDVGSGDVTTLATVPVIATATAMMVAREPLIVAGLVLGQAAFTELSPTVTSDRMIEEGVRVDACARVIRVSGPAAALLST